MSEIVRVIYEGVNQRGFALGQQEHVSFTPGMNEIPKDVWDKLIGDTDPGGVQHFLDNRQMVLADKTVQQAEEVPVPGDGDAKVLDIGTMNPKGAIEVVENTMTQHELLALTPLENARKQGGRKTVIAAIEARQHLFDELEKAQTEPGDDD